MKLYQAIHLLVVGLLDIILYLIANNDAMALVGWRIVNAWAQKHGWSPRFNELYQSINIFWIWLELEI